MGMEIALIPAAMFIMGIGMMIYMKKKRDSLAPGYAQQEMKRFVKEMVPQLSEEEFHVIDCPGMRSIILLSLIRTKVFSLSPPFPIL